MQGARAHAYQIGNKSTKQFLNAFFGRQDLSRRHPKFSSPRCTTAPYGNTVRHRMIDASNADPHLMAHQVAQRLSKAGLNFNQRVIFKGVFCHE